MLLGIEVGTEEFEDQMLELIRHGNRALVGGVRFSNFVYKEDNCDLTELASGSRESLACSRANLRRYP